MEQNATTETEGDRHAISFVVGTDTLRALERIAANEGLSRASIARRALLRDLAQRSEARAKGLSDA